MQTFIYGFCGALALVGLLAVGAAIGWVAHRRTMPKATPLTVEQKRKKQEQKQAFDIVQNYTVERAYGMVNDPVDQMGGDDS